MIAVSQTKSANYLFIVAVLKSMRESGVITLAEFDNRPLKFEEFESKLNQTIFVSATPAEYERAKRYYQKLTGSDLVIAD